jgi:DNA-binding NarL/FixJ family response regulator
VRPCETLTDRERHVIDLLAVFGLSNRQLAITLSRSQNSIKKHMASIMDKLGCHTRLEIIKWRYHNEP